MAAATDELSLLERVSFRLGSAKTDEQLQASVCKFLPPVLLKLSSSQEGVRKKVMELLVHINKRLKSRPQVQLPVEALILQYQDPAASSFVINFTIIYIKLGFPRLELEKQAELVPSLLNAIEGKPLSHQDSLLLIIMPALAHIEVPTDPEKRRSFLGLQDKPYVTKQFLNFMLDVLLLPYGSVPQTENQQPAQAIDSSQFSVPPGMSDYAFKRVIGDNPPTAERLEILKMRIVRFLYSDYFPTSDILTHLIVAGADTRLSVAFMADLTLSKKVSTLDWSSMQLVAPLYALFLGTDALAMQTDVKPEMKRLPASIRIRIKLLRYLCRVTNGGFIIPQCIQVVFDSLYGKNTNAKLKSLALQFTLNIVQGCSLAPLTSVAGVILNGMIKLISEESDIHKPMAYAIIGQLGQRIPSLVNKSFRLLHDLFEALVLADGDLESTIRSALMSITSAFVFNKDNDIDISEVHTIMSTHIKSTKTSVRFVAMHYAATIFPPDDAPSRYILLLACGDSKQEISSGAKNALYGTINNPDNEKREDRQIILPDFSKLVAYIHDKMQTELNSFDIKKLAVGTDTLPYSTATVSEIITYLRVCLAKSADIPISSEPLQHPCEHTPLIGRYLELLYKNQPEILEYYLKIILFHCHASADQISLQAFLEVIGSIPQYTAEKYKKELPWLYNLLTSTKLDIRQLAARIYAIIIAHFTVNNFESQASSIMDDLNKKSIEARHGALLTLTYMIEKKLLLRRSETSNDLLNWPVYITIANTICTHLHNSTIMLMDAAIKGIGILGKTYALPLPDDGEGKSNKKAVVEQLFSVLNNARLNTKIKENAALSLGQLCVGENFPHTTEIINKIIATVKETKDIEIHLIMGEALVCCVQGQASPEGRDAWTVLPSEHKVPYSSKSTELLIYVLDELLKIFKDPHPNSRQAICVWLLALLKHNIDRDCIKERFSLIHNAFIDFLSDDSDIVQDIAAKGLGLVHVNSKKEDRDQLVSSILNQFTQGRRTVQQVTPDTKLFEEGQLGKSPTGGNLSTYKEICSLATELQKPELVYYFMHLANHNAVWTSKKGAAFGFAAIANVASEELNKYLPGIIPRLYRYQFDPTPKIQRSMTSIWRTIVPSTSKAVEQYHKEILADIIENLNHHEWRVRISCCNALADLLRTGVHINLTECAPELWKKLFRVMDDIHEGTRLAANNTAKQLCSVCVRYCDVSHGKEGEEVLAAILPVLLDIGVIHTVDTIRSVSLQAVSQLVSTAGSSLKPSLVTLIPALLATIGESENPKLSYLSNVCGGVSEAQDAIDHLRAGAAKGHYATETITKCIQYIDADILKSLMPKVIELIKCSVGLGTKVACSHFLILLSTHFKQELQPYAGKVLSNLMNGLSDRNTVIRKNYAVAIGHMVGSAKDSSVEKLFNTLNTWYMEREDDSARLAIGHTLQSINTYNQEVIAKYSSIVIPLTFFAMHAAKTEANKNTIELWVELWNDVAPGTETGIRQNLERIIEILRGALEMSSWTAKMQSANAIDTVASTLGSSMDAGVSDTLIMVLIEGLRGRTWNGKERLLVALATLTCNSKQSLSENRKLLEVIVETLHRESKKEAVDYRRHALQAFATVVHELDIDKFSDVYDIAQDVLTKLSNKNNDDEDDCAFGSTNRKEDMMKLQETIYDVLGKAWPTCKETQDKFCIEFVNHCQKVLPNSTRPIQVSILTTLNLFVDKLVLLKLKTSEMSKEEKEMMNEICDVIYKILQHCLGVSKYTAIRKEALNMVLSLGKKMLALENTEQIEKLTATIKEFLPELTKNSQPEIRMRMVDIKKMLEI